jgi:hypothetical protein
MKRGARGWRGEGEEIRGKDGGEDHEERQK